MNIKYYLCSTIINQIKIQQNEKNYKKQLQSSKINEHMKISEIAIALIKTNKWLKDELLLINGVTRQTLIENWCRNYTDSNPLLLPKNIACIKKHGKLKDESILIDNYELNESDVQNDRRIQRKSVQ